MFVARFGNRLQHVALALTLVAALYPLAAEAAGLMAGVAKVDITNRDAGPVNDPLYVKALVLKNDAIILAIITVDAVAIGEIGHIGNDYLPTVRARLESEFQIAPEHVLVNASHCHGVVCADVDAKTVQAVTEAMANMAAVRTGAGAGREDRIMENRRLRMLDGTEIDSRHAYSLPPDDELMGIGPVDPEIGVLRFDREDGRTLAALYNFAMHPIQGVPNGANTADVTGFASTVIEENLGDGAVALFLQGCAGDINPVYYKDVDHPRDAEPLGNMLGLSALQALREVQTLDDSRLSVLRETISLPRANTAARIAAMEAEQTRLVESLQGTSLNLKTFLSLTAKYSLAPEYPSYYAHGYMHDAATGREDLTKLDTENRRNMEQYAANIATMEKLTRLRTNLDLLRKHHTAKVAAGASTIDVEVLGVRVGDFVLVTFPG